MPAVIQFRMAELPAVAADLEGSLDVIEQPKTFRVHRV